MKDAHKICAKEIDMLTKSLPRKSVNLSLSTELVAEAKALDLNISRLAEEGIAEAVREERAAAGRSRTRKRWNRGMSG
jgi:post-segregation antitoxin (ccd killing protein)